MAQHGGGDVVRQVAGNDVRRTGAGGTQQLFRRDRQDVGADEGEVRDALEATAEVPAERLVDLYGDNLAGPLRKLRGQDAAAGADFDDGFFRSQPRCVDDASEDAAVGQEVLAKALAGREAGEHEIAWERAMRSRAMGSGSIAARRFGTRQPRM